jgi:hypothetical protein
VISLRRFAVPLALLLVAGSTTAAAADTQEPPKVVASCDQNVKPGEYTCFAQRRADLGFRAKALGGAPAGYGPSDL